VSVSDPRLVVLRRGCPHLESAPPTRQRERPQGDGTAVHVRSARPEPLPPVALPARAEEQRALLLFLRGWLLRTVRLVGTVSSWPCPTPRCRGLIVMEIMPVPGDAAVCKQPAEGAFCGREMRWDGRSWIPITPFQGFR
jgi:hypothetical protein